MRLGILPAAGKSERWGGYPKELLPISNSDSFMSRAVQSMEIVGCDAVLIITNPSKSPLHTHHLRDWGRVLFAIQQGEELWGAITTAIRTPADEYYFMMPDTYVPYKPFPNCLEPDFGVGVFQTNEPTRFGVLRGGQIHDKVPGSAPCLAWGTLAWKRCVAEHWLAHQYRDHTAAINDAMRVFNYSTWGLDYYFDIASMDYYREFLLTEHGQFEHPEQTMALTDIAAASHMRSRLSDE